MGLVILTVLSAVGVGYGLFRLYSLGLSLFLKKMSWDLKELKSYPVTPTLKFWDRTIELGIFIAILCKIMYT